MTYTSNDRVLRASVLAYALASLAHHVHNAVYLDSYNKHAAMAHARRRLCGVGGRHLESFAAHGTAMHATIGLEVLAATVLAVVVTALLAQFRVIDSPK